MLRHTCRIFNVYWQTSCLLLARNVSKSAFIASQRESDCSDFHWFLFAKYLISIPSHQSYREKKYNECPFVRKSVQSCVTDATNALVPRGWTVKMMSCSEDALRFVMTLLFINFEDTDVSIDSNQSILKVYIQLLYVDRFW